MWRANDPRKQTDHPHFDNPCHVEKMVPHLFPSVENILPFWRKTFLERKSFDKTFFFSLFSSLFHTITFLQHTFSLHHMHIVRMTHPYDFGRQEMLFFNMREIIQSLTVEWRRDIRRDRTETRKESKRDSPRFTTLWPVFHGILFPHLSFRFICHLIHRIASHSLTITQEHNNTSPNSVNNSPLSILWRITPTGTSANILFSLSDVQKEPFLHLLPLLFSFSSWLTDFVYMIEYTRNNVNPFVKSFFLCFFIHFPFPPFLSLLVFFFFFFF